MTKNTLGNEVDKDSNNDDLEEILASLVDKNGVCMICGQDHSFKPTFQDTERTDIIPSEVFRKNLRSETMAEVTM